MVTKALGFFALLFVLFALLFYWWLGAGERKSLEGGVGFADLETEHQLTRALERDSIPYRIVIEVDGSRMVRWPYQFDSAARAHKDKVVRDLHQTAPVQFLPPARHERNVKLLEDSGIPIRRVVIDGEEYVTWPAARNQKVRELLPEAPELLGR